MSFHVLTNPALKTQVASIQDKNMEPQEYRARLSGIGSFMAYEISDFLDKEEIEVETNFGKVKGIRIKDENIIFVAVLRASIPMVNGALKVYPHAQCGMVSARRLLAKEGEDKNIIKNTKPKKIIVLSVVCAREGVDNILTNFPDAEVFTAHLGQGLNTKGYIVPDGPGDAGDRSFGLSNVIHSIK